MTRLRTGATLLAIALFVVLPLYEFVDYGEHWHHDGDYVSLVLGFLFVGGLALICRLACSVILRRQTSACLVVLRHLSLLAATRVFVPVDPSTSLSADTPRFLILRDFRI
jgi:hypothetical protein